MVTAYPTFVQEVIANPMSSPISILERDIFTGLVSVTPRFTITNHQPYQPPILRGHVKVFVMRSCPGFMLDLLNGQSKLSCPQHLELYDTIEDEDDFIHL